MVIGCGSDKGMSMASLSSDAGEAPGPSDAAAPPEHAPAREDAAAAPVRSAADSCDKLACKEPATCVEQDGKASCACPKGYDDTKGDGSECEDKDECADSSDNDCDKNAHCENQPGGYKCTCRAPAYQGDGKSCSCADGFEAHDGDCLAPDSKACEYNQDCVHNHCVSGVCCASPCDVPDVECRAVKGATCEDGKTCKYLVADDGADCDDGDACTLGSTCKNGSCQTGPQAKDCNDNNPCTDDSCDHTFGCKNKNNTAACDDKNPCTSNEQCNGGSCVGGTERDCSAMNDACNTGACDSADGSCKKKPVADGKACDDGKACTKTDQCKAGTCAGDGDACGPNATACAEGVPNTCTCAASFHTSAGVCVPDNDECAAATSPCGANATCFDPSNAAGDVTCTCKQGYQGDAKAGCTAIDPCMDNPCGEGRGTCAADGGGGHRCTCAAGYMAVGGQCVCDLNGTFAVRTRFDQSWPAADTFEAGSDSAYEWSIERHMYDANGVLTAELVNCGDSNFDLCGQGLAGLIPAEAYSQYVPASVVHRSIMSPGLVQLNLPAPLPKSKFEVPIEASIDGISLADPAGAWPSSRKDIQGSDNFSGTAVNDARWVDSDGDAFAGSTAYTVGPNGAPADGSATAPVFAYATHSPVCPRSNPNAARLPYNYPPAPDGLSIRRVKRVFSASRVISGLDGTFDSCDGISGVINGPDDGKPHFDSRIAGCLRDNGSDDVACSSSIVDSLDDAAQFQNKVDATSFVMKRVADGITCDQVLALTF